MEKGRGCAAASAKELCALPYIQAILISQQAEIGSDQTSFGAIASRCAQRQQSVTGVGLAKVDLRYVLIFVLVVDRNHPDLSPDRAAEFSTPFLESKIKCFMGFHYPSKITQTILKETRGSPIANLVRRSNQNCFSNDFRLFAPAAVNY